MIVSVCREFSFEAAHYLPMYDGSCKLLHGHSFFGEFEVTGNITSSGMVVDFKLLDQFLKDHIISYLDHKLLNYMVYNPTVENILVYILDKWNMYGDEYISQFKSIRIRLHETAGSFAEIKEDRHENEDNSVKIEDTE